MRRERIAVRNPSPLSSVDRSLRVFAFDPSQGASPTNVVTLQVPYEPLLPGPIGRYVAVIDGEPGSGVDLDDVDSLRHGGLAPSALDFRFHQQMVYAVASHTIQAFEQALGREISWPWAKSRSRASNADKLRIFPHAMREANAYFDDGALYFGYFRREEGFREIVYTCLAYDLVAHVVVRPLLYSVFPHSIGAKMSFEALAFHEGFADLIALLEHFDFQDALFDAVTRTCGRLWDLTTSPDVEPDGGVPLILAERTGSNPLLELGRQFGNTLQVRSVLRATLDGGPESRAPERSEAHQKGENLVAAIFDALFTVYARRTRDLLDRATVVPGRQLHPDVARRLVAEASATAQQFLRMCVRALDYCPPVNVRIDEFLRALVTSDAELVPDDEWRFRDAVVQSFGARGIGIEGMISHSEEGIRWPRADPSLPRCDHLRMSRTAAHENARILQAYASEHRDALGLAAHPAVRIDAGSVHISERVAPDGEVLRELVAQLVQGSAGEEGATTLVLDGTGMPKYVISKTLREGLRRVAEPLSDDDGGTPLSPQPRGGPRKRRPLKIFAFDPTRGRSFGNRLTVTVPYERLGKGPVGTRIAVIDYDASNGRYYDQVDLEGLGVVLGGGIDPTDLDPRFHQQMVYAVASAAIERFELGLGRPLVWPWVDSGGSFRGRLLMYPHAMHEANAYYDRQLHAVLFGYFSASDVAYGGNLPGQIVFTCLSHDIIVHETTHAMLDSVHPYLLERTNIDAPAFHEGFADILALLQHFSFAEALDETILKSGGRIYDAELPPSTAPQGPVSMIGAQASASNPLVELARQFGEALGTRAALRSALGSPRDAAAIERTTEAHDRGAIFVAAVFDAFFSLYVQRTEDLMRFARSSGAMTPWGDVHPELARRLAREVTDTAQRYATMFIRAVDHLPPVDIEFGDFLRAVVTADSEAEPRDPLGYRATLVDAFAARGIYPKGTASLSEEALNWNQANVSPSLRCGNLDPDMASPTAARDNAIRLGDFARHHARELGLSPSAPIRVHSIRSVSSRRADPHGIVRPEFHVQLGQRRVEPIDPEVSDLGMFTFRGGATVVLDESGSIRYVIGKGIDNDARLLQQQQYLQQVVELAPAAAYGRGVLEKLSIAALHRGLE